MALSSASIAVDIIAITGLCITCAHLLAVVMDASLSDIIARTVGDPIFFTTAHSRKAAIEGRVVHCTSLPMHCFALFMHCCLAQDLKIALLSRVFISLDALMPKSD